MKYDYETEEEFLARVEEARRHGICIFRDNNNREFILDLIDAYIDVREALYYDAQRRAASEGAKQCHDSVS